jgi:hypothetical protein
MSKKSFQHLKVPGEWNLYSQQYDMVIVLKADVSG